MSETWPDRPFRCPTCDSAFPELVAAGGCDDHWHEPEPRTVSQWRSEVERWAGILEQFSYAKNPVDAASRLAADMRRELAAQPPAPADDAATVLAGLREEMQAVADEWHLMLKLDHAASAMETAIALVEAAQQRLADRGQGDMADEFEPYLAEAMKRPGFRAAYEAALREEENDGE